VAVDITIYPTFPAMFYFSHERVFAAMPGQSKASFVLGMCGATFRPKFLFINQKNETEGKKFPLISFHRCSEKSFFLFR